MKKVLLLIFSLFLLVGCSKENSDNTTNNNISQANEEQIISGEDFDAEGGADSYSRAGDTENSKYFKHPDFYNMESGNGITIIPQFKTFQQTTEWSCGNASALMVLNHYGRLNESEYEIAEKMNSSTDLDMANAKPGSADNFHEYGTDVKRMTEYFENRGDFSIVQSSYKSDYSQEELISENSNFSENDWGNLMPAFSGNSLYSSDNEVDTENWVEDAGESYFVTWLLENLENNRPIMVEWGDWDGHWQIIIGYDNNNTPGVGDDILIFADPYDTSDHLQDGYFVYSLERWFTMWKDRNVAPKPYQLQPFLIVEPN